jgi:regulator of sigma E protease
MAVLSINLGILNLLPIPILDGGHLFFLSVEGIKGKPLSMKKMEIAQQVGLVILILLMTFAFYNDISRFSNDISRFSRYITRIFTN